METGIGKLFIALAKYRALQRRVMLEEYNFAKKKT